jgi:hypothetical protein
VLAPLGVSSGREEAGLVVSPGNLEAAGDQTAPVATIGANSSANSPLPVLRALAQLSETMIMLVCEGEMGHARAVHEAIGKLLNYSNEPTEARTKNIAQAPVTSHGRKEPLINKSLSDGDLVRLVNRQHDNCRPPDVRQADDHRTIKAKMLHPAILPRIEQPR